MNVEELLRDTLREQAEDGPRTPPGFADRVLAVRRRRRTRRIASVAAAAAVVLTAAIAVPSLDSGGHDVRPLRGVDPKPATTHPVPSAHPGQSPVHELVAAGRTAMAAYYTQKTDWQSTHDGIRKGIGVRTYWLLDPKSGHYEKDTRWSWVAVAPGLRTAAVLERHLPASRIGLLDLTSGKVARWIPVDHPVGGLEFSRDGTRLVATTYSENPDKRIKMDNIDRVPVSVKPSRTGFYVFDVASGKGAWADVGVVRDDQGNEINTRQDFGFCRDGRTITGLQSLTSGDRFYDVSGREVSAPHEERYRTWFVKAGLSPDGTKMAGDFAGEKWYTSSWILDPRTGKHLAEVHGQQLLAWADDKSLIAWDIAKGEKNEFHNRLVLVTIGSDKEVPLSGFLKGTDGSAGRWEPLFADR
ncbi:WD40 repeat domain-containing protein [Streptomyces sp. NBC_00659]|uniref:WD40 repeat domain-containing protein n=1 Tax=Streptomyces sp. NBC_00659 TaxID=2903669 RepID=UPI002E3321A3|nr:WD40 repeat domain-containing protein [Streptomyces sp. NBC_00659]